MKLTKRAFTLIEMLIVIVIIGILAAALVPRLVAVQGRARDTKRKADLGQIGSALAIYKTDNGTFPLSSGSLIKIATQLSGYMSAVPTDAAADATTVLLPELNSATGYGYFALTRGGVVANASVLGADTESDGNSSNSIIVIGSGGAAIALNHASDISVIETQLSLCSGKATKATAFSTGSCTAPASGLRYYYAQ